jgi:hypothetical protein
MRPGFHRPDAKWLPCVRPGSFFFRAFAILLCTVLTITVASAARAVANNRNSSQSSSPHSSGNGTTAPATFSEADAARLFGELARALEAMDQRAVLKLFDANKVPDYAVFRDQVAEFFEKYEAVRVRYHLTQASPQGELGVALADLELEKTGVGANVPNVRQNFQSRLVAAWDGKRWKIVDVAPRSIFN